MFEPYVTLLSPVPFVFFVVVWLHYSSRTYYVCLTNQPQRASDGFEAVSPLPPTMKNLSTMKSVASSFSHFAFQSAVPLQLTIASSSRSLLRNLAIGFTRHFSASRTSTATMQQGKLQVPHLFLARIFPHHPLSV